MFFWFEFVGLVCLSFDMIFFADYENFYPKDKKEIPKGDEQKSQSKGWVFSNSFRSIIVSLI